jgi:site-specific DNA recombinase
VIAVLSDDETGSTMTRPGFTELRRLVQERSIQHLIVYSVDRLHRNLVNQVTSRTEFQAAGTTIHYVRRGELTTSPEDILFDNIDGVFAEYERHKIRERTMRGTEGKAISGRVLGAGRAPYGYAYAGTRRDRTIHIQPEQATIVAEIYARYHRGEGVSAIAADLTARQLPTWTDLYGHGKLQRAQRAPNTWNTATLYDILHDELYAGTWQHFRNRKRANGVTTRTTNPGDWVGVPVPAIVGRDLWEQVQTQLAVGSQQGGRNVRNVYGLRSMIRCGHCGAAMTGMTQVRPNTADSYYRCINHGKRNAIQCYDSPYVRASAADTAIWALIRACLDPDTLAIEQAERERKRQATMASSDTQRAHLDSRKTELQRQIDKQLDLYQRDIIDLATIERSVKPLRAQLDDLDRQLASHTPNRAPSIDLATIATHYRAALDGLDRDVLARREALLRLEVRVMARRVVNGAQLTMTSMLNADPLEAMV